MWTWLSVLLIGTAAVMSLARSRRSDTDLSALSPDEVGYLARGPQRALLTAVNASVVAGILRVTWRGMVVRGAGVPPAGAGELERAVYRAACTPVSAGDLLGTKRVPEALAGIHRRLASQGLLVSAGDRRAARGLVAAAALIALARWALAPDGSLAEVGLQLAVVLALAGAVLLLSGRTAAGNRALRQLQRQHPPPEGGTHITPKPEGTSFTAALYGIGSAGSTGTAVQWRHDLLDWFSLGDRDLRTSGDPGGFGGIGHSSCAPRHPSSDGQVGPGS